MPEQTSLCAVRRCTFIALVSQIQMKISAKKIESNLYYLNKEKKTQIENTCDRCKVDN